MPEAPARKRRHWADVVVIVVSLALAGLAVWPSPFTERQEVRFLSLWQVYALAGGLGFVALVVGQRWRWRALARLLLVAAVVVLAVGVFTMFRDLGLAAALTIIVPSLLLLLALPFFGPMPPERPDT